MMLFNGRKGGAENNKPAAGAADAVIFDADMQSFEEMVIKASLSTPVLVDFWAPWCGPCKQLGPVLEAAVNAAGGKIKMAKINVDENQPLAQALRVQSIPTVFAFFQGQPVTAFTGAKSAGEIKGLIDQLVKMAQQAQPDALDVPAVLTQAGEQLVAGNLSGAHSLYAAVLAQDDRNAQAYAGMIRVFIAAGDRENAQHMLDNAPPELVGNAHIAAARTALELAGEGPAGDLRTLAAAVEKNPADLQARYDLAQALFTAGQREAAIDALIEILRRNKVWEEDKARKLLLRFFEALGPSDPLTLAGRRQMSSVLFS